MKWEHFDLYVECLAARAHLDGMADIARAKDALGIERDIKESTERAFRYSKPIYKWNKLVVKGLL